jgi:Predicted SAM-dependent methyltransferases
MTRIILKKGREDSLLRFHPWVFSGAIERVEGDEPAEGDVVAVYSHGGEFLASGHYQIGSIAVRVLSFESETLPPDFWEVRLQAALDARKAFLPEAFGSSADAGSQFSGLPRTTCYRLVHGEGDGLPGLIIDWYDGVCVMQAHSVGMFLSRDKIVAALRKVYGTDLKAVYDKSSGTAPFKAGLELNDGYLWNTECAGERTVLENGHKFIVNWEEGQKTGFFLDQRENRHAVERYARGRRVLNLFCYTGGFSIYALAGGALSVDSVDSSATAMNMVDRNVALNGFGPDKHTSHCCDAIDFVKDAPDGRYDMMIVDPPAFAKHRGALSNALRAYQRLNAAAIAKVAPGGIVFTFSCSQVVDKQAFALAVFSAAAQTGRKVRIIDRLNQPADHSVNIYHPEGEYLKGLVLYVE